MRVAVAGSGDVARYFSEEFTKAGLHVVILTRSVKSQFENRPGITQFVTDYSVPSLVRGLDDCVALVSTILDYTSTFADVHMHLIEACKQSSLCKRFIPAEYGGNLEDYPDQPGFYYRNHESVRNALREQNDLEWTLISVGWLIDYIVPQHYRYLKDVGEAFPVNLEANNMVIPGTGNEPLDILAARDMAKAVAKLLKAPKWEEFTYISGEKTTWNDVAALMIKKYPSMPVSYRSLGELIEDVRTSTDDMSRIVAEYRIFSASHAGSLDPTKVAAHRKAFFEGISFRSVGDFLQSVEDNPDLIA
ncbi:hypothetical protein BGZ61DRAFT_463555 [Ilyonectria robusta]|uniref:uncharacterized protein n=1 Tax=Ilyonectria robusta TaxID=1079257 RepID=UPI001E8D4E13|nr:uncharacterized protein BGZ61DRAFT_463555 [Ilyonectria robusta]KAH8661736.1 hypothetical protein BGZ61DRAFT_463555 [Ilyonectria robusta]